MALAGVAGLLLGFHESWDVTVFNALVLGGAASLGAAVAWDLVLGRRGSRDVGRSG